MENKILGAEILCVCMYVRASIIKPTSLNMIKLKTGKIIEKWGQRITDSQFN